MKAVCNHTEKQNDDRTHFEWLYDKYAPKAFGFITNHTDTKEQAEEIMMNVFFKVWENIKILNEDTEKKMISILLSTCKPLYKNKIVK